MRVENLYNEGKDVYIFYRDDYCNLKITKFVGFFPYWYEKDPQGQFVSYKGDKLRKIIISNPAEMRKKATPNAFESDIQFVKRFMVDKIDIIEPAPIKYCFIDIETLSLEMPNVQDAKQPISCISIYNSLSKETKTFYLPDYESEYMMLVAFTTYMKKEKFGIWFSWNVAFDYNYLYNRTLAIFDMEGIKNADLAQCISPIDKNRYGDGEVKFPAGLSIVDYLMWFKKITLGREKMYTLDYIAQKFLKVPTKKKVDFSKLSPELKQHNIDDVKLMVGLEEQMQLVKYYDEIRRITQVEWEDFEYNSRAIDMLLLKEAKTRNIVLPMRPTGEGEEEVFEGAFREIYETGRLENIGKADVSSAYPYAIIEFCLDPANIVSSKSDNSITIGDTEFKQDPNALIPTIIKKLLILKSTIKKQLENSPQDDPNHKNLKIKYDAIKSLCNTAYGVTALKFFRLFDIKVASATTYIVRSLLHYIKEKLEMSGHPVVYIDTDGVFYKNPTEEMNKKLNEWVQQWAKELFKKEKINITFDYEGAYESLLLLAKCRYVGRLRKTNGELEIETKGIEAKRKDSTKYMGNFQKILIDKILDNEPKEKIYNWIKEEIKNFPKQQIIDIAFPCKMAKSKIEYKSVPIFSRALDNTPEFKTRVGDSFYYIKMEGLDETKKDMVKAFDEERFEHIKREEVDWQAMLERNIVMKLDVIFEAMKWNLTEIYVAPPTSKICDKCLKDKSFCRFPETGNTCKACITIMEKANKPHKVKRNPRAPILPLKSSITVPTVNDNAEKDSIPIETAVNKEGLIQPIDNKEVKVDKIDDKLTGKNLSTSEDSLKKTEVIQTSDGSDNPTSSLQYIIKKIERSIGKPFVEKHHYSGTIGKATLIYGLFNNEQLCGVLTFGQVSGRDLAQSIFEGGNQYNCFELLRLVVLDECKYPRSKFISFAIKDVKKNHPEIKCLVSFADQTEGHFGYVYQASNWIYTGQTHKKYHYIKDFVRYNKRLIWDYSIKEGIKEKEYAQKYKFQKIEELEKFRYIYPLTEIKLKLETLSYPKEINKTPKTESDDKLQGKTLLPAREVSKQTCVASSDKSVVKVHDLAPILKEEPYNFHKSEFEVKSIDNKQTYEWILYKHYAHRMPVICHSFGLYWKTELVGVITYGSIPNYREYNFWLPINLLELNRLIVNDGLPKNSLSYFVSQSLNMLHTPSVVISFSDYRQGHYGYIYQATNWRYTGDTVSGQRIYIMKDGTEKHQRHEKTIDKSQVVRVERTIGKPRYYYFCGTKKEKKELLKKLQTRHSILPYPKGVNKRYDTSYKIKNLNINAKGKIIDNPNS